ncbi:MAG: hypothetical protein IPL96_03650 [Holophagaceae bacterium]|nr:hypothetical protein [Holophagaceae bacterium]
MTTAPMDPLQDKALHRAFQKAYGLGLVLCVCWPLVLQLLLGPVIKPGQNAPAGVIQQLGYTFTGLTFLAAAFVTWRSLKVRGRFKDLPAERRPRVLFREVLLYAALFELSCLYGILYWALVGGEANRYARSFIVLTSLMFFFFVPRYAAWREAVEDSGTAQA